MNDRDTKFAGFARLLWQELEAANRCTDFGEYHIHLPPERETAEAILARRAYDLVYYALDSDAVPECFSPEVTLSDVPDMTAWPDEESE